MATTPMSRVALDRPPNERSLRRLRVLLEADGRVIRPRPITLPWSPSREG